MDQSNVSGVLQEKPVGFPSVVYQTQVSEPFILKCRRYNARVASEQLRTSKTYSHMCTQNSWDDVDAYHSPGIDVFNT